MRERAIDAAGNPAEPVADLHVERSWRRLLRCSRSQWQGEMRNFLEDPAPAFAAGQVLKRGNTATVARLAIDGRNWIVKRYNVKGAGHRLRLSLTARSRCRNAWHHGWRLLDAGIPTARPVAMLECRWGPVRDVAYLVLEDLGDRTLRDELARAAPTPDCVSAVVALFSALAALGLAHGDTKATNFLVHEGRVALIDLDSMRRDPRGCADDARRFLANWRDRPEVGLAFTAAFRNAGLTHAPGPAPA